ncbi:MAG TPA: hypothetical protein VFI16_05765, partial [Anaeromyxobacteraceae bacterium]|nr:hypothetical protein [Anaeromyxobacteraceae bacterium]
MSDLQDVLRFLEEQKAKQASHFATVKYDKVLSFMGTTGQPGQHAAVAVTPLIAVEPGPTASE